MSARYRSAHRNHQTPNAEIDNGEEKADLGARSKEAQGGPCEEGSGTSRGHIPVDTRTEVVNVIQEVAGLNVPRDPAESP